MNALFLVLLGAYLGSRNTGPKIYSDVNIIGSDTHSLQLEGKAYIVEDGMLRLIHYQTWVLRLGNVGLFTITPPNISFSGFEFAPGRERQTLTDGEVFALGEIPLFSNESLYTDPNYQSMGAATQTFFHVLQVMKDLFPNQQVYITSSNETTFYNGLKTWQSWLRKVKIIDRKNIYPVLGLDSDEFAFEAFLVLRPDLKEMVSQYKEEMNQVKILPKKNVHIDFDFYSREVVRDMIPIFNMRSIKENLYLKSKPVTVNPIFSLKTVYDRTFLEEPFDLSRDREFLKKKEFNIGDVVYFNPKFNPKEEDFTENDEIVFENVDMNRDMVSTALESIRRNFSFIITDIDEDGDVSIARTNKVLDRRSSTMKNVVGERMPYTYPSTIFVKPMDLISYQRL